MISKGEDEMAGRSPMQLLDIHLVELRHIEESYFQDYAKVHEHVEKLLAKQARPLAPADADIAAGMLLGWLSNQAEKNVPPDRLAHFYRCGLGHICAELCSSPASSPEEIAARAYEEMKSRGWLDAAFDAAAAAAEAKRFGLDEKKAHARAPVSTNASGKSTVAKRISTRKEDRAMSNIDEPGKATVEPEQQAESVKAQVAAPAAKKPVAKKAAAAKPKAEKKPVAKKAAAVKPKAEKKPVAKKAAAAKPKAEKKVAAKKPVAKKLVAKKPVAKKAAAAKPKAEKKVAAKKPVAKKAVAKKPVVKKAAAKPKAEKKAVAKKAPAKKATAKK
jgi:histone H1/5